MDISSNAAVAPDAHRARHTNTTLARRRLRLGITGVGASVLLACTLLLVTLLGVVPLAPDWRVVPGPLGVPISAFALALAVFAGHATLLVILEHAGGRRAVRHAPSLGAWTASWLRGVAVLAVGVSVGVTTLVTAGSIASSVGAGTLGAAAAAFALSLALLIAQGPVARLTAALEVHDAPASIAASARDAGIDATVLRVVESHDDSFVGGWMGFGAQELWIPAAWTRADHADLLQVQWHRRTAQRSSYARRRGWWRAAVWPAVGLLLTAPLMPYSWNDARLWLVLPALATLWSFVAVLLLPSVSRAAVYYADARAAVTIGATRTIAAIAQLDRAQDDEPERAPVVELIFHPIPSVANRARRLRDPRTAPLGGGHQQTRLTLYASLATGSLLGRMVHCNIGRPALWVVYPGD